MKISLNWLQSYLDLQQDPDQIAEILTEIGLEVEGYEEVEQIKGSLKNLVVGEVLTCGKHPNADRLSVTTVNTGEETIQIVCGAPNVAAGQKVIVAPVGTILYDKEGKAWKINKGKIRGEVSEGMICAQDEIGLGDDHSGIMVLSGSFEVGEPVANYFDTSSDIVFEIGLTPNRSDATSHIGVARDLIAALQINYQYDKALKWPDTQAWAVDDHTLPIAVKVLEPEGCPRYAGVCISKVVVQESPEWLKKRLTSIGLRPINNVVDVTNFVLHEFGQPLHAFDYDKIEKQAINVRTLESGTSFISLDEQNRKLAATDLIICDGSDHGMCIGGVFGGLGSGVTAETTDIFLESAHFNAKWIRRTSERHLLFTDAAKVFEKGSDPNICVVALKRAALLIKELTGGKISSEIVDIYPYPILPKEVTLEFKHLNRLIGTEIDPDQVEKILQAMEMEVQRRSQDTITVLVPTNKADVTREADLIEEVLRIYGFNKIPDQDRMSFSISASTGVDAVRLRNLASDYLVAQGFFEIMGLSMIDKKYVENKVFHLKEDEMIRINNTSNVQIEVMRPNLLITALETMRYNQNRQTGDIRIFEFGKSYLHLDSDYQETDHLAISVSGWGQESWLAPTFPMKYDFYALKSMVLNILNLFGVRNWKEVSVEDEYWDFAIEYTSENRVLTKIGKISSQICEQMDIRNGVFFADIFWSKLLETQKVDQVQVRDLSKFPSVRRDLALIVEEEISFAMIQKAVKSKLGAVLKEINLFDVYRNNESLGEGKKQYAISLLLSDSTKTFSDKDVDGIMNGVLKELEKSVGARLR
ncbi:MAG: phenylalanine--tRNA ligase subunit beta [Saprospiraceae bacterium]|nr:phenylalanine--tRNA ligase subunit beta [Saprospiraceae bacterium]